uniref:HAT C-terminal dimerisation domain-containing protein n=1 Tax=Poecilia mexicana TaxID=48701 RepID=A0A3B3WVG3_9TELE
MADNRKYDSGAQKRRKRKEKEHRAKEATNKMPKLTSFFKPVSGDGAETSLSPAPQTLSYANTGTKIRPEPLTMTESVAGLASVESESVEAGSSSADGKTTVDLYSTDPTHCGEIDESVRAYWPERGPENCQNMNVGFQVSERVYKHQKEHENSEHHRKAMLTYVSLAAASGRIDTELQKQFESECSYWTEVLRRVVSVVKFLAERGLALRGASDKFGRTDNGNYLGILELISEFDPFLKSHIKKYGNAGSGKPSYLSSQTCEEFIQLMGDRVLSEIVSEVKMAKYFSISVDSTPDMAHVDQLTFVLRRRFEKASAALQSVELDLCTAVDLVGSLREYIGGLRDQFDRFESQAKKLSPTVSQAYRVTGRRSKTPKPFFGESATSEVDLSAQQKFSTSVFLVVVDRLLSEINRRDIAYDNLNNTFGFLNNFSGVTVPELRNKASYLQSKYSADLEMDFVEEIVQFKDFIRDKGIISAPLLLQFIREKKLQDIFPNVDIAFRLYLTFPVTNASGERSFSKLKIVKNRLRSTMGQERLNHLTLMSIESDLVRKLDFSDLVKEFAAKTSRKVGNFSNFISD